MLIELNNINKTYMTKSGVTFRALSNVSTAFDERGLVFILGKSGSGKSTLLNIIGALDGFGSGEMHVAGNAVSKMNGTQLDYYRNTLVGFIFQEFNLLDSLSVMENVRLAVDIRGEKQADGIVPKERVLSVLESLGIADKAAVKARNLSGGQRQRVAIARALIKDPQIILADEPTGSLDSVSGGEIMRILQEISKTKLVIVVTHDAAMAKCGDRIIEMKDGEIYRDVRRRREGESLMAEGVDVVSGTLVRLQHGAKVDAETAHKINETIYKSGRKSYLNVDTQENRMKALFPNLRDAVSLSRHAAHTDGTYVSADDVIKNDEFVPYRPDDSPTAPVQFKRSRIAFWSTLKLGIHNIGLKKFRLVMILLVTIISFTMFGMINTLMTANTSRALARSIAHDSVKAVSVSKNSLYQRDGSNKISIETLDILREKNKNCTFYSQHRQEFAISGYSATRAKLNEGYLFDGFKGITEIDSIESLGFTMYCGTGKPAAAHEVVISKYAAQALIAGGAYNAPSLESLLFQPLKFMSNDFHAVIVGIYDADYSPYANLNFYEVVDSYNHVFQIFVGKDTGFANAYLRHISMAGQLTMYTRTVSDTQNDVNAYPLTANVIHAADSDQNFSAKQPLAHSALPADYAQKKPIRLLRSADSLDWLQLTESIKAFNLSPNSCILLGTGTGSGYDTGFGANITNIVLSMSSSEYYIDSVVVNSAGLTGFVLDDAVYARYIDGVLSVKDILVGVSSSQRENVQLLNMLFDLDMQVNADFSTMLSLFMGIFLNFKALVIGAVVLLSLIAILLMYNFISTSIRLTKRTIGLLRALGVKKFNTYMIYVMEALFVAVLTFAASLIALILSSLVINASLSVRTGLHVPLMVVNPLVILLMLGLSLGVALVSAFIPWFRFTKITPVEAITATEE